MGRGSLAAFALEQKMSPRSVREDPMVLEEFQQHLRARGVETHWPKLTPR